MFGMTKLQGTAHSHITKIESISCLYRIIDYRYNSRSRQ
uniref:Uncharacterized protein n=1 Tax=Triticum urartu TaxID=4572 RepID=A0A8R7PE62_TRIUA